MIRKITLIYTALILILTGCCVYAGNSADVNVNKKLQRAKELYNLREDPENLKLAINVYESTLKLIPEGEEDNCKKRAEIFTELSRCCFKMAEYHAKDNKEKALWFEMGEEYGRNAMTLDPVNIGGYYWMAQNLGEHGSISKLYFLRKKSDFEDALEMAEKLDDPQKPYDYSGVCRTLAAYYTPRPLWGNLEKALAYAKKIEDDSGYLSNLSVLASLYWKTDREKAKNYAKCMLNADLSGFSEARFENSFEQKEAAKKWGKLLE